MSLGPKKIGVLNCGKCSGELLAVVLRSVSVTHRVLLSAIYCLAISVCLLLSPSRTVAGAKSDATTAGARPALMLFRLAMHFSFSLFNLA